MNPDLAQQQASQAMLSLAIAALLAHTCSAAQLNFIDSTQQPFMRADAASKALSGPGATAVFGALLGASAPVHRAVSNQVQLRHDLLPRGCSLARTGLQDLTKGSCDYDTQVDAVISPDVFNRPRAILSIALAGVSEGERRLSSHGACPFCWCRCLGFIPMLLGSWQGFVRPFTAFSLVSQMR